jgi:hypothetical protein
MRIVAIAHSLAIQGYNVKNMFVCFLQYGIKYALASNGVKTQSSRESKAASQQLCVWWAFSTSFLQGKSFKTIMFLMEKKSRKIKLVR